MITKSQFKEYHETNGDWIVSVWIVGEYPGSNIYDYKDCEMRSFIVKNEKQRDEAKASLIKEWEQNEKAGGHQVEWV